MSSRRELKLHILFGKLQFMLSKAMNIVVRSSEYLSGDSDFLLEIKKNRGMETFLS